MDAYYSCTVHSMQGFTQDFELGEIHVHVTPKWDVDHVHFCTRNVWRYALPEKLDALRLILRHSGDIIFLTVWWGSGIPGLPPFA